MPTTITFGKEPLIMTRETSGKIASGNRNGKYQAVIRSAYAAAAAASLALVGVSAHASCADLIGGASQGLSRPPVSLNAVQEERRFDTAAENIVGTWHVSYSSDGVEYAQAFIQWHGDRTEWENINKPVLGGNICMGSWKPIDATHVYRNHFGWIFDNGVVSNYFNETETDEVSRDGNSYVGVNTTSIYSLTGTLLLSINGTAKATRLAP
jgi:hypothetical protein